MLTIFNVLCAGNTLAGQATSENPGRGAAPAAAAIPERVSPLEAAAMLERVVAHVRDGEEAPGAATPVSAATVTVRLRGERIARGEAAGGRDPVGRAMLNARKEASAWIARGDGRASRIDAWAIELEVGGAWTPRRGTDWRSLGAFAKPGVLGVAARLGEGEASAVLMPSGQLRYGLGPMGVWRRVSSEAGAPLGVLRDLVATTGLRTYTFEVTRVVSPGAGEPLRFPHRTGEVVGLEAITTPGLHDAAASVARFLRAQKWVGLRALGMRGDLVLASGAHDPEVAPIQQQMVAAMALARFARTRGVAPEESAHARRAAIGILEDALLVEPGEELFSENAIAAAAFLVATAEASRSGPLTATIEEGLPAIRGLVMEFGASPEGSRVEAGVAALVALALVRDEADLGGPERHGDAGTTIARALMSDLGPQEAHSAMPWLGWALIESSAGAQRVAGDLPLEAFRERSERLQAGVAVLDTLDRDLAGGFLWGEDRGAYPDWRSARLASVLGTMLGDGRLTHEDERIARLDSVRRAARFLRQLMVDREELWSTPAGVGALGGVRRTVWGDQAAIDASAMTLLALCEILDGVDRAFGK